MAAKRKRVTLNEFKAWLDGVEELQLDDWTPTPPQWVLIRAKIDNIVEQKGTTTVVNNPVQGVPRPMQPQITGFVPPPDVGGIPAGQVVEMTPEAKALLQPGANNKQTTPNIDTADGNYSSSFTQYRIGRQNPLV